MNKGIIFPTALSECSMNLKNINGRK